MAAANVALVRCENYDRDKVTEAVARQFDLLGGIDRFVKRGDRVLLKPNFIAPRRPQQAPAQTHPAVILAVARLLKDIGAKPFVSDSPAWTDARTCAQALGLIEPLTAMGVDVVELNRSRLCPVGSNGRLVTLSTVALEADAIINLPKFKAHQQLVTTFAVKNMFGCVSGKRKALWHFRAGDDETQFCTLLIDIYRRLDPVLTIIDGIVAMQGPGPIRGTDKHLGYLIAGTDPIACELACTRLVEIEPEKIPVIRTARQIGFGCTSLTDIDFLGDALPSRPSTDFEWPQLSPIKFSLRHVCRSTARQILLRLRAARANRCPSSPY